MALVEAVVTRLQFEPDWDIFGPHVRLGTRYLVDPGQTDICTVADTLTGRTREIEVVWAVTRGGGWVPVIAFGWRDRTEEDG